MNEVIEVGQFWKGDIRTGKKTVLIERIGNQPKKKILTVTDISNDFTYKVHESLFRRLYKLVER